MLDAETKARIDSARDILVGKVPDPKSQVEQITIALIYKFMDDMDRQSEELGGKATFFAGEFKKYAWNRLLDNRLSGHERLLLYAEGIEKMNTNKNTPQLFRDIFKGVFLPYRDPETLNLFLKEIHSFSYDHSEKLGDAFEYLLSVLGSQGEAGQFRTPRHIIDFIVAIVDPKKNDTILDPACGTAGFLISSYKHILAQNTKDRHGDKLTADERGRLISNFCGYDISPDMVRLSRANLYLHGFANPRIHEYDTLTSEERWDEHYDVILANPPFMSPKGGIRPHNRFSIKATRSEVLFVDYIAEHLNVNGRAGIIVPEGIIFQSQNAYKKLRKTLVEGYLWCVVSLPGGCFNPYSGVKTSILLLDKALAKHMDEILFVKIGNDGLDLGAQRRPVEGNDLPQALELIQKWRNGQKEIQETQKRLAHTVSRKRLLESGDCNLSGDRYRDSGIRPSGKWPMVKLGEVCNLLGGGTPSKTEHRFWDNGTVKWISAKHIDDQDNIVGWELITEDAVKESATNIVPSNAVVFVTRVSVGKMVLLKEPIAINQDLTGFIVRDSNNLSPAYLFWAIKGYSQWIINSAQGLGVKGVTRQYMADIVIPLPPLEVQEQIVAELSGYRKIIEGAKQIIANYKPNLRIDSKWPMVTLSNVCESITDGDHQPPPKSASGVPFITITNINDQHQIDFTKTFFVPDSYYENLSESRKPRRGDILYTVTGSYGIPVLIESNLRFCFQRHIGLIRPSTKVDSRFIACLLASPFVMIQADKAATGVAQKTVSLKSLRSFVVPLPHLDVQRRIVAGIDAERAIVDVNRKLVEIYEQKIQSKLAEIWGETAN